jgi:hypothetical protein
MDKKNKSVVVAIIAVAAYAAWVCFIIGAAIKSSRRLNKAKKAAGTSC